MTGAMDKIEASVVEGRALSPRLRQRQLSALHDAIYKSRDDLITAVRQSYGYSFTDASIYLYLITSAIKQFYDALDLSSILQDEYSVAVSKDHSQRRLPYGCVYIVPSSNDLPYSAIVSVAAALAAGNCVVLEIQPTSSDINRLIPKILGSTLDADIFATISTRLSAEEFPRSHGFTIETNSEERALSSSIHLATPAGHNVAVIDRSADLGHAAKEIVKARFRFNGRSAYAPDIVLINEFALKQFSSIIAKDALDLITANVDEDGTEKVDSRSKMSEDKALKDELTGDGVTILLSGSNGTIAIIRDRSHSLLTRKISGPVLVIHPVTSMDDAIDFVNSSVPHQPCASLYTFASPSSCKYLTQFINSRLAFANHVPFELLVGPPAPLGPTPTIQPRYTPEMFTKPSPLYANPSAESASLTSMFRTTSDGKTGKFKGESAASTAAKLQTKLRPMDEGDGAAIGYFEQGLITGGIIILGSVITVGVLGWKYVPSLIKIRNS